MVSTPSLNTCFARFLTTITVMIDSYLNGPRTLSNTRLSYLILSKSVTQSNTTIPSPPPTPSSYAQTDTLEGGEQASFGQDAGQLIYQHDLLICAMHFLGDGMALHQFANDFFGLFGGQDSDEQLTQRLSEEWKSRWSVLPQDVRLQQFSTPYSTSLSRIYYRYLFCRALSRTISL